MSHAISESESSAGGGTKARRQLARLLLSPARQRICNVNTLLNHIRRKSKQKLVRHASVLPAMRGRSSGFVDKLGKCNIEISTGNSCIAVAANRRTFLLSYMYLTQFLTVLQS